MYELFCQIVTNVHVRVLFPDYATLWKYPTESHRFRDQSSIDKGRRGESRCRVLGSHLQDLRSACLVLLRSRGVVLVAGTFVAVFTRDSSSSSTPSARLPLVLSSLSTGPSVIIRPETEQDFPCHSSTSDYLSGIDFTIRLSARMSPLFYNIYINHTNIYFPRYIKHSKPLRNDRQHSCSIAVNSTRASETSCRRLFSSACLVYLCKLRDIIADGLSRLFKETVL